MNTTSTETLNSFNPYEKREKMSKFNICVGVIDIHNIRRLEPFFPTLWPLWSLEAFDSELAALAETLSYAFLLSLLQNAKVEISWPGLSSSNLSLNAMRGWIEVLTLWREDLGPGTLEGLLWQFGQLDHTNWCENRGLWENFSAVDDVYKAQEQKSTFTSQQQCLD